ncbi:MAG: 7-carboxy-7-deazaguanine synthase QueE [Planctomycetia bacterium]|nr:7-carboxy-7-deazaguanine synthase QueE [Planctomycetia bacterium]RLT15886.1 MAG: 7-carboxy-7-deazaguanine synthase QueE [Planctomycetota bacterium]
MRIAEIYTSLQGEGLLAGTPSTFVRVSGCNLRCHWCDTPFASWEPTGEYRTVESLHAEVVGLRISHLVVTGGEPLIFPEIVDLCWGLRQSGVHVTIETAGTVLPAIRAASAEPGAIADLMSISPKLSSSGPPATTPGDWQRRHVASRRRDDVLHALMAMGPYQLKFVIDTPDDLKEACLWLDDLGISQGRVDRDRVMFMPQGKSIEELAQTTAWLEKECRRVQIQLAPRHHIAWFGNTRGT